MELANTSDFDSEDCRFESCGDNMKDGLYRVTTSYLCAGFVIKDGKLDKCAPILRKKINYWKTIAELIAPRELKLKLD